MNGPPDAPRHRVPAALPLLLALLSLSALSAPAQTTAPLTIPAPPRIGPPPLSISHEARNAIARAEDWLAAHPADPAAICQCSAKTNEICQTLANSENGICQCLAKNAEICQTLAKSKTPENLEIPETPEILESPETLDSLLPLLLTPANPPDYAAYARLAETLDASPDEILYLDAQPIPWRPALVRQLILLQRVAPDGTAYWSPLPPTAPPDAVRPHTLHALRALRLACGLPDP